MIYPIVKLGDPVLEKRAEPVSLFDDELKKLVDDMFESMYAAHGVGLAAPQIGISKRLAVIDVTFKEDPDAKLVLANPEIIHTEGRHSQNEGCLSIPDFREAVTRARKVTIRAQDVNGHFYEKTGEELLARAVRNGDGQTLFDLFTRTRAIRRAIIDIGQDTAAPDFGRNKT